MEEAKLGSLPGYGVSACYLHVVLEVVQLLPRVLGVDAVDPLLELAILLCLHSIGLRGAARHDVAVADDALALVGGPVKQAAGMKQHRVAVSAHNSQPNNARNADSCCQRRP